MAATYDADKLSKCSHIVVDIEGTTTSITFVKDILFPYACEKVEEFLQGHWEEEAVQEAVEGMRLQAEKDILNKVEGAVLIPDKDVSKEDQIKGVTDNLKWLISIDNKGTFMKKLSGLIWEKGYTSGDLKGHVYNDVPVALESWQEMGKQIYIYSSGSVHAQKLLMKHSELGDLSSRFIGNFDTVVGGKQEVNSYKNIIKNIGCQPEEALFLTDIPKEAEAANEAGLNTCLVIREGNAALTEDNVKKFHTIKSFHEIKLQALSTKRKQEEEESRPTKVAKTEEPEKTEKVPETEASMEVDTPKEITKEIEKGVETDAKPTETEANEEKKTEEQVSIDKEQVPESMETDTEENKKEENVKTPAEETVPKITEEVAPSVAVETIGENKKTEETHITEEEEKPKAVIKSKVDEKKEEIPEVGDVKATENSTPASENNKAAEELITDVNPAPSLLDEESKSSLDNINVDIAVDADEEEKITDLLDAGEALDKECDDILSKVDQVTSKDLAMKPFIEKEISNKDSILDDAMEVIAEAGNVAELEDKNKEVVENKTESVSTITNGKAEETESKDKDTTVTESSKTEKDTETVVEPAKETSDNKSEDVTVTENKHSEVSKSNGDSKECLANGSKTEETEVNGKEVSGNGVEENGSNGDEAVKETNGANGDSKDKAAESETIDIKTKKVTTTEEVTPEQVPIEAET